MSEDAPEFADNVQPLEEVPHIPGMNATLGDPEHIDPNSPTVEQDPAKAYEMAMAGDEDRTKAVEGRRQRSEMMGSTEVGETGLAVKHFNANQLSTKKNDELAKLREEEAGIQYEVEKPPTFIPVSERAGNPEFKLPMNVDELIDVLSALRTYDESGEGEEYIDSEVIWNEEWGKKNPELYAEIYDKLSQSEDAHLRQKTASGINFIVKVDRAKGLEVMQRLLADEDIDVLDALYNLMDFKVVFDKEAGIENNLSLLKGYAEAMRRKREKEEERRPQT